MRSTLTYLFTTTATKSGKEEIKQRGRKALYKTDRIISANNGSLGVNRQNAPAGLMEWHSEATPKKQSIKVCGIDITVPRRPCRLD